MPGVWLRPARFVPLISLMNAAALRFHVFTGTMLLGYGVPPMARPEESRVTVPGWKTVPTGAVPPAINCGEPSALVR